MNIICAKEKLREVIQKAEKVTGKNSTLPILSTLYLEAKNNTLTIKATNLDVGIEISIPVKVEKEGVCAVQATTFSQLLGNLSSETVSLTLKEGVLVVHTDTTHTGLKTFLTDDFPIIPRIEEGKEFEVNPQEFIRGLKAVWYSASVSSIKPELSSVYVYSDNGTFVCVATDSFRLAEKKVKTKKGIDIPGILIPFKNVAEIIRILEGVEDDITLTISKDQIVCTTSFIYLTSRVVDGNFPDYKQILPKEFTAETTVLKNDLIQALKISNVFVDTFNQVRFLIDKKQKQFTISSKNSDIGEHTTSIGAVIEGEPVSMGFNYRYITDCFQSLSGDSVILRFSGVHKPLIIQSVDDASFTYLVMPMNR